MTLQSLISEASWNKKIKLLRILKGWSQCEVAQKCNTGVKNFWNWESGNCYPRIDKRKAIALAFGVPINEIFLEGHKGRKRLEVVNNGK